MLNKTIKEKVAKLLLDIKAVTLSPQKPFTWASGIQSPIYCDNRLIMSYPNERKMIADSFSTLIKEKFPQTEVIAGTATSGIPYAAWISHELDLPMIYSRAETKSHGKQKAVEGLLEEGQKVILIEDLISTGGSSIKTAQKIQEVGGDIQKILSIFTYNLPKAQENFQNSSFSYESLSDIDCLVQVALENQYISEADCKLIHQWKDKLSSQ